MKKSVHEVSCPFFSIEIYALDWVSTVLLQLLCLVSGTAASLFYLFYFFDNVACCLTGLLEINALILISHGDVQPISTQGVFHCKQV